MMSTLINKDIAKGGDEKDVLDAIKHAWQKLNLPKEPRQSYSFVDFVYNASVPNYDVSVFTINYHRMYVDIQRLVKEAKKLMKDAHKMGKYKMNLSKYTDKAVIGLGIINVGLQLYEHFTSSSSRILSSLKMFNWAILCGYVGAMGSTWREEAFYKKIEKIKKIVDSAGWIDSLLMNYFTFFIDKFDKSIFTREEFDAERIKDYMCYLIFMNHVKKDPLILESKFLQETLLRKLYAVYNTDVFPLWWYKKRCEHLLKDVNSRKEDAIACVESHANSAFIHGLPVLLKFKLQFTIPYIILLYMMYEKDDDIISKYNDICESNEEMLKHLENLELGK